MYRRVTAYLFIIALLCTACAPLPQAVVTPAPTQAAPAPAPTPAPTPRPLTAGDAFAALDAAAPLHAAMEAPALLAAMEAYRTGGHAGLLAGREAFQAAAGRLTDALAQEGAAAWQALCGGEAELEADCAGLSWQYVAALAAVWGEDVGWAQLLDAQLLPAGGKAALRLKPIREALAAIAGEDANRYSTGRYLYAYLTTVYNDAGEESDYVYPGLPEGYEAGVVFPLGCKTSRRNGWYNARDKGKRKHTGMDLRAPEDEPILSCTAGEVVAIGENAGAGNYVLVLDDLGYEYHYYHMVRMTDFLRPGDRVAAGEVIGHVGNTGNSDANHLHLTIINPDGSYLNPYYLMCDVYPH